MKGIASNEIEVYTLNKHAKFTRTERFKAPYCSMVHDFLVSQHLYHLFVICPMVCGGGIRVPQGESYWR
ncbi:hypothetical protein P4S72_30435 [Vibrio sp. PP-XX7]